MTASGVNISCFWATLLEFFTVPFPVPAMLGTLAQSTENEGLQDEKKSLLLSRGVFLLFHLLVCSVCATILKIILEIISSQLCVAFP